MGSEADALTITDRSQGFLRRVVSVLAVLALAASSLSVVALLAVVTQRAAPASAGTNPVTQWSTLGCGSTEQTATIPAGSVSMTVQLAGGGNNGEGAVENATFPTLGDNGKEIAAEIGCGNGSSGTGFASGGSGDGTGGSASALCYNVANCIEGTTGTAAVLMVSGGGGAPGQGGSGCLNDSGGAGGNAGQETSTGIAGGSSGSGGNGTACEKYGGGGGGGERRRGRREPFPRLQTVAMAVRTRPPAGAPGPATWAAAAAAGATTIAYLCVDYGGAGGGGGGSSYINSSGPSGGPTSISASLQGGGGCCGGWITLTWNESAVTVTNPGTQTNNTGSSASLQISASDNDSLGLTYSATGLPTGLSINSSSGLISGTPTATGAYSTVVTVHDTANASSSVSFTWNINNLITVTNPGTKSNVSGTAISALQMAATDSGGLSMTWTATGLPTGLTISSSGSITGTPTTAGSYSVTATAKDTANFTGSATFTWNIPTR